MKHKKSEKGQAIILIVFAMIGLIALTGLTVDGGVAYSDRRRAQNAADAAAFAGALANAKGELIEPAAKAIATTNGYTHNDGAALVTVTVADTPAGGCEEDQGVNKDITVQITSTSKTYFAPVIGLKTITNTVTATARACGTYVAPIFDGNAIVSLNDGNSPCAFDSGNSNAAQWHINDGGLFSNGCAFSKNDNSVIFGGGPPTPCVSTVDGVANGFANGEICTGTTLPYDDDYVDSITPPHPCDGVGIDEGTTTLPSIVNGHGSDPDTITFTDDVFCISNFDAYDGIEIILENSTLYVTDPDFDLKFAGGGGFSGTPTISGDFSSYAIIVADNGSPCPDFTPPGNVDAQVMEFRGNSFGTLQGTILAPTACIDLRGNAGNGGHDDPLTLNSQIIAWNVSSNGDAAITVNYQQNANRRQAVYPAIELIK